MKPGRSRKTAAPGSRITFAGSAADDEGLKNVEISLRNNATREQLASDGTWGTDVIQGWYRVSPSNLPGASYNWTYTTPFTLNPGSYSFSVRATDDIGLTTSSTNQGRLTISAQVPGDAFPDGRADHPGVLRAHRLSRRFRRRVLAASRRGLSG